MRDPEFIEMRNRFLIGILVAIIFVIPVFIFVLKTYKNEPSDVSKNLDKNKTFVIFFSSNNCSKCNKFENVLTNNNVSYFTYNIDTNDDYEAIMKKLDFDRGVMDTPAIFYIKKGKLVSSLVSDTDETEIYNFLDYYKLLNTK